MEVTLMSARLIKAEQPGGIQAFVPFALPQDGRSAMPFNLPSPSPIVADRADAEAERIIAAARAKAAEIEQEAKEKARQMIDAEVAAEIDRTIDPWLQQLQATVTEIDGLRTEITSRVERDVVRLAIEIAKKVVHREVTIDNEIVMTLIRIGLSRMHNRIAATVHLHPEDFRYVVSNRGGLEEGGHALELVEDRSIGRGGCLLRTELGDVDARIEQQFAEIERVFLTN
jgi:flagellar assembly protein FliH